jgi:hypothetical protein
MVEIAKHYHFSATEIKEFSQIELDFWFYGINRG